MEKVTSTPKKNNKEDNHVGVQFTQDTHTYEFAEQIFNGNLTFKCITHSCQGTIIVQKKRLNYKFLSLGKDHTCKNTETDKTLLYKTAISDTSKDESLNSSLSTTSEINVLKHHRNLLLCNITKQKEEINLLKQLIDEKDTLIENLKTSLETTEAGWKADKSDLEELKNTLRIYKNKESLQKSKPKQVKFVQSGNSESQDITAIFPSKSLNIINEPNNQHEETPLLNQEIKLSERITTPKANSYIILGDQHVKNMYEHMKKVDVDNNYSVQCYPGKYITDLHLSSISSTNVDKTECIILMAGSNDVFENDFTKYINI